MKTEKTIRIIGRWVPEPMIPAEVLEGQGIIDALSGRLLELMERDLTIFDGKVSYPRLRLSSCESVKFMPNSKAFRLNFRRSGAPWCQPLAFWFVAGPHHDTRLIVARPLIQSITVGYPIYPAAKWVVSTEQVA